MTIEIKSFRVFCVNSLFTLNIIYKTQNEVYMEHIFFIESLFIPNFFTTNLEKPPLTITKPHKGYNPLFHIGTDKRHGNIIIQT